MEFEFISLICYRVLAKAPNEKVLVPMQGVLETIDTARINKNISECASKQRTCPRTLGALFTALGLSSLANVLSL